MAPMARWLVRKADSGSEDQGLKSQPRTHAKMGSTDELMPGLALKSQR